MAACRHSAAKSAPVYPTQSAATASRATPGASGSSLAWCLSIAARSCSHPLQIVRYSQAGCVYTSTNTDVAVMSRSSMTVRAHLSTRRRKLDLPVEPPGPPQRRLDVVGAVCRCNDRQPAACVDETQASAPGHLHVLPVRSNICPFTVWLCTACMNCVSTFGRSGAV